MIAQALSFIPAAFHADILAGTSTVDLSSYLNSGLASAKIIQLPTFGQMSIGSSLVVPSGGGIVCDNYGCTIKALPNFGNIPLIRNATMDPATNSARDQNILLRGILIDGNKVNNSTATEFSHGVQLYAVDGATLDLQIINPKGDGLTLMSGYPNNWGIGCAYITGKVRTEGCHRQGVAIICGEQIDLDVYDTGCRLLSVDIEPDVPAHFVRNIFVRVLSVGAGNGMDMSGGVAVSGDGAGSIATNITIDFEVLNSGGYGVLWRDCRNLHLRGSIDNPTYAGLVGIDGGFGPSQVTFEDVWVRSPGSSGMAARETVGSTYDGTVSVAGAGSMGVQIENARGGVLTVRATNGSQQGMCLDNVKNMTFSSSILENNAGHNLWLMGGSSGNRFHFLKSTGSTFGWGFLEAAGCNDNRAFLSRVSGNGLGNVSTSGALSYVQPEP